MIVLKFESSSAVLRHSCKIMYLLLVSEDFVQDPPDEEEKSMRRKYDFMTCT